MNADEWLRKYTFYCPWLRSRLTAKQCDINRSQAKDRWGSYINGGPSSVCAKCTQHEELQGQVENMKKCNLCKKERRDEEFRISEHTGKHVVTCVWCEKKQELGPWKKNPDLAVGNVVPLLFQASALDDDSSEKESAEPESGENPEQTVDLQQNDALSDSEDGAADKKQVSGEESGARSYFGATSLPLEYLDGLEDCQINIPGAKKSYPGMYVSIFQNCTMSPSVDLRKQYPRGASHAVVGYKPAAGELRIKILSLVPSDISRMTYKVHKDQKTIHLQGLINGHKLHDCAGKKFKADFDHEKAVVIVYLSHELQEAA